MIDVEHVDGGATGGSEAGEDRAGPVEMFVPVIDTGMEQPGDFAEVGIATGDAGSLVTVTAMKLAAG